MFVVIGLRLRKREDKPTTPLQIIVRRFDGSNYLTLTDEEARIVETMRRLEYIEYDSEGEIRATRWGKGIIDGTVETDYETPRFIGDYLSRNQEGKRCGTAGSRS